MNYIYYNIGSGKPINIELYNKIKNKVYICNKCINI